MGVQLQAAAEQIRQGQSARGRLQASVKLFEQENRLLHDRNIEIARLTRFISTPLKRTLRRFVFPMSVHLVS
jgi:hypothetical protein